MKKQYIFPFVIFFAIFLFFSSPFLISGKLPIPADTIIGLFHPFRDLYAQQYPQGIPYKNALITDPVEQQYPWKTLTIALERTYQLPLWNPYSFSGTPLLANFQAGPFYPLNILFFIFIPSVAWSIYILLQPMLACLFMYWYLRSIYIGKWGSTVGGIVFAFCGFSVVWMEWGSIIHVLLWLPLILFAQEKFLKKKSL